MAAMNWLKKKLNGTGGRSQKKNLKIVDQVASHVQRLGELDDAAIVAEVNAAVAGGVLNSPEIVLAGIGVAASRRLGLEPFACQYQAALALLGGDVVHMATGEGKTLVGAMAATGYGLQGRRVHAITVNDYLADRDAAWMRPLVEFFGLSVGAVTEKKTPEQRRSAYACDVVYGPVNEIGFDVLRDQLVTRRADAVITPADVAIVDEADSVLVDEALVPLVLAGSTRATAPRGKITQLVKQLSEGDDFTVDDDRRNVFLTDKGAARVEEALGIASLYDDEHVGSTLVQVNLALHAQQLLLRDVHYLVRGGKVALIDAAKGRVADLQRWPDGLQAAVEAKEGLAVTEGGRILDTITIQALLGRYPTVCGMTGTAVEATEQLRQFYGLHVSVIEPNKPLQRFDEADRVFATREEKHTALIDEIRRVTATGQPILVGTQDVAESELIAEKLAEFDLHPAVLNAKNDAEEAAIIAEAGAPGRITVSTQMAGRGTDIKLGGADESLREEAVAAGGLAVIGSSRHMTSRLDNQLRGRAGRQGDPGTSLFFVSLEDDMIRTGGAGEDVTAEPDRFGRIEAKRILDWVEHCQRVTEGQLLEIHSQTWKYNKLINDQRKIIDARRHEILDSDAALELFAQRCAARVEALRETVAPEVLSQAARDVMLFHMDEHWAEHLAMLDDVRESIHLRAIARETPLDEFHRIAVSEFKNLAERAIHAAVETFVSVTIDRDGAHLADEGLVRPSATWTYMVNDNPLSGSGGGLKKAVSLLFGGGRSDDVDR